MSEKGKTALTKIISIATATCMLVSGVATISYAGDSDEQIHSSEVATKDNLKQIKECVEVYDKEGQEAKPLEAVNISEYDGFIIVMKDDLSKKEENEIDKRIELLDDKAAEISDGEIYTADSLETASQIVSAEDVEVIEPDYICEPCLDTTVLSRTERDYGSNAAYIKMTGVESVWKEGIAGQGIYGNKTPVVAVIDSGLMGTGKNPKLDKHKNYDYKRVLEGYNVYKKNNETDDMHYHGTVVTSMLIAKSGNSIPAIGYMPKVYVKPYCVYRETTKTFRTSDIILALEQCKNYNVDVINISLVSSYSIASEKKVLDELDKKGVIVVAAAGNSGKEEELYPASYDCTVSAGGINESKTAYQNSTLNNHVTCIAPAVGVVVNYPDYTKRSNTTVAIGSGTSYAAPTVAALAAMAKSMDPNITNTRFKEILKQTCVDIGAKGYDKKTGYGLIRFDRVANELKRNINNNDISISYERTEYTGKAITPKITVKGCKEGIDYKCIYSSNINAGTATVTVKGINHYKGESKKTFTIEKKDISSVIKYANIQSREYTGKDIRPSVPFTKTVSNNDYKVTYENNKNIGNASMTVKGQRNYVGTYQLKFRITPQKTSFTELKPGYKSLRVKWKKKTIKITGYQVRYWRTDRSSSKKIVTISKNTTTSKKIKSLKAKKKYGVSIRTFYKSGKNTYYSGWSSTKYVTTK